MNKQVDMFGPSLAEARRNFFIDAKQAGGTTCKCCDKFGKIYSRKFNRGMAITVIYLYQNARDGFIHLPSVAPRYILNDNQVGKLVFWGMAENEPNEKDSTKNKSGSWKILPPGVAFVEGKSMVWSHVIEYLHHILCFRKDKQISISDALGRPFNYRELMRDHP